MSKNTIITITYDEEKKHLNVESNIEKKGKGMERLRKMILKAGEMLDNEVGGEKHGQKRK